MIGKMLYQLKNDSFVFHFSLSHYFQCLLTKWLRNGLCNFLSKWYFWEKSDIRRHRSCNIGSKSLDRPRTHRKGPDVRPCGTWAHRAGPGVRPGGPRTYRAGALDPLIFLPLLYSGLTSLYQHRNIRGGPPVHSSLKIKLELRSSTTSHDVRI